MIFTAYTCKEGLDEIDGEDCVTWGQWQDERV